MRANPRASQAKRDQYVEANGLYPGFSGMLRGYKEWLCAFVQGPGQWPRSLKGNSDVWSGTGALRYSMMNTLRLGGIAAVLGISIGIGLGIVASRRAGGYLDSTINSTAFFVGAVPPFVSGVVLQLLFAVTLEFGSRRSVSTRPGTRASTCC